MELNAVLFEVNGTMAESEDFHRLAFNESFKEFGLNWFWDEAIYKELTFVEGGKERIKYYMERAWPEMLKYKNLSSYIQSIHDSKSQIFEDYLQTEKISMRPGIYRLICELKNKNIRLALVSSTSEKSLLNLFRRGFDMEPTDWFEVIGHGECTPHKKPSSDIYLWTLSQLKLPSQSCLAIESSPRGYESAIGANINVIVTPSQYSIKERFENALTVISDLGEPDKPFKILDQSKIESTYVNYQFLKKLHNSNVEE
tara:strand:+ start:253 stop:1020 length:768 start_codon:yes stop_codon:yes gene_type:complete